MSCSVAGPLLMSVSIVIQNAGDDFGIGGSGAGALRMCFYFDVPRLRMIPVWVAVVLGPFA